MNCIGNEKLKILLSRRWELSAICSKISGKVCRFPLKPCTLFQTVFLAPEVTEFQMGLNEATLGKSHQHCMGIRWCASAPMKSLSGDSNCLSSRTAVTWSTSIVHWLCWHNKSTVLLGLLSLWHTLICFIKPCEGLFSRQSAKSIDATALDDLCRKIQLRTKDTSLRVVQVSELANTT